MNTYTIGASMSYASAMDEETFAAMEAAGLGAAEFTLKNYPELDFDGIAAAARRHNIQLWSAHLPFRPCSEMDISLTDPAVRAEAIRRCTEMIGRCAQIGIDKFVVHPGTPMADEGERPRRILCSADAATRACGCTN